jgi:hypothetical protein
MTERGDRASYPLQNRAGRDCGLKKRRHLMAKRIVTLFTLFAFALFDIMCTKIVQMPINEVAVPRDQGKAVLKVETRSGEVDIFSAKSPARIVDETVVGRGGKMLVQITVPGSDVESVTKLNYPLFQRAIKEIKARSGIIYSTKDPDIISITPLENGYIVKKGISPASGSPIAPEQDVIILRSEVKSVTKAQVFPGQERYISSLKTVSSKVYSLSLDPSIASIEEASDRFVIHYDSLARRIPFSDIESVWVKRADLLGTVVLLILPPVLAYALFGIIILANGGITFFRLCIVL